MGVAAAPPAAAVAPVARLAAPRGARSRRPVLGGLHLGHGHGPARRAADGCAARASAAAGEAGGAGPRAGRHQRPGPRRQHRRRRRRWARPPTAPPPGGGSAAAGATRAPVPRAGGPWPGWPRRAPGIPGHPAAKARPPGLQRAAGAQTHRGAIEQQQRSAGVANPSARDAQQLRDLNAMSSQLAPNAPVPAPEAGAPAAR